MSNSLQSPEHVVASANPSVEKYGQKFLRYEFKYPMPDHIARSIHALLLRYGMRPDPSAAERPGHTYTVTSLYLDSPQLNDYYDKAGGFLVRKKVRIRIYEPFLTQTTPEIWLEKKQKHDMLIAKKRIRLSFDAYQKLINGSATSFLREQHASKAGMEIMSCIVREQLKPLLIVRYERAPLLGYGPADLRITFDSNIQTCFSKDLCYTPSMKNVQAGTTVMEVKFSTVLPSWFREITHRYNLVRTSFSKYANSLETLHPFNPLPR